MDVGARRVAAAGGALDRIRVREAQDVPDLVRRSRLKVEALEAREEDLGPGPGQGSGQGSGQGQGPGQGQHSKHGRKTSSKKMGGATSSRRRAAVPSVDHSAIAPIAMRHRSDGATPRVRH